MVEGLDDVLGLKPRDQRVERVQHAPDVGRQRVDTAGQQLVTLGERADLVTHLLRERANLREAGLEVSFGREPLEVGFGGESLEVGFGGEPLEVGFGGEPLEVGFRRIAIEVGFRRLAIEVSLRGQGWQKLLNAAQPTIEVFQNTFHISERWHARSFEHSTDPARCGILPSS